MAKLTKQEVRDKIALTEAGIISNLLERSTYVLNERIYVPGGVPITGPRIASSSPCSGAKEAARAMHGCFKDSREHPFFEESLDVNQIAIRPDRTGEDEVPGS